MPAVADVRPHPSNDSETGHSLLICEAADYGAEDHAGSEPGDEEPPDVLDAESIERVQGVDVGTLEPVAG